ncbi:hypothetical protein CYMTET_45678 [Cymbomonas tetramitiformis]|uniref:Uncharacterized protein n=1 Tax=Cymbomonas tetramitiformis TaxID=36881 RepID=A0AAE0BXS1_9CHLO|nr:hypothetical protein CYMTET_45678 [Cymbomonas tetramitiformis]
MWHTPDDFCRKSMCHQTACCDTRQAFERAAAAPSAVVHHDKILRREKKMRGAVNEEMITTAAEASHALQKAQLLLQSFVDASDEA